MFDDGDHLAVVLRREGAGWVLTDEGHTRMHRAEDADGPDPRDGARRRIGADALAAFGMENRGGELILEVRDSRYGDALLAFVQGLLRLASAARVFREGAEP